MSDQDTHMLHVEAINERFDRVERKIDKITDAMVSLARTEEKILSLETARQNEIERLNRHSEKLDEHTLQIAENTRVLNNITKLVWVIIPVAIAGLINAFYF